MRTFVTGSYVLHVSVYNHTHILMQLSCRCMSELETVRTHNYYLSVTAPCTHCFTVLCITFQCTYVWGVSSTAEELQNEVLIPQQHNKHIGPSGLFVCDL